MRNGGRTEIIPSDIKKTHSPDYMWLLVAQVMVPAGRETQVRSLGREGQGPQSWDGHAKSSVTGCPFLSLAATILPSRSFMSAGLSVRASTAMISLATRVAAPETASVEVLVSGPFPWKCYIAALRSCRHRVQSLKVHSQMHKFPAIVQSWA